MKSSIKLGNGEEIIYEPAGHGIKVTFKAAFFTFSRVLTCDQAAAACFAHEMALEHSSCAAARDQVAALAHVQQTTASAAT
jgi:hypothetical protein